MGYQYSEAQLRFLRKKFAKDKEEEKGCDCPGCEKCTGFVRGCTCDHDLEWLRLRHGTERKGDVEVRRESESVEPVGKYRDEETGEVFPF